LQHAPPDFRAFIAYSALPGTIASNGATDSSPFTETWLTYVRQPNLEIGELFKRVRRILAEPPVRQEGPVHDNLLADFIL